jgi:hypothetical protein
MTELMEMAQKLKACDDFQERLALLKRSRDILNEAYRLIGIAPHRDECVNRNVGIGMFLPYLFSRNPRR